MSTLARKRRRDIRKQRWQFIAVGATVVVGVMMFAATFDSYRNLTDSYFQTYDRLAFADMTISGGDDGLADTLLGIPGVEAVTVRHTADLPITIGPDTLRGRLVGMPTDRQPDVDMIDVQQGRYLEADGVPEAVAEVHVARTFDLEPGDAFTVAVQGGPDVEIVGVAASSEYIWPAPSTQEIFVDPKQFGVFFVDEEAVAALPASVSVRETLVLYADDADPDDLDAAVHAAAEDAGATSIIRLEDHPSHSTLKLDVDGFGAMAVAFPVLFLTAAGMAVYVLLTRIVVAQRSIIGTLRASGMSSRELRNHYLGFGITVGVVGSVVGIALGVVSGALMTGMYTGLLDIPDTVIVVRPVTIVIGLAFGLIAGAISAYAPARTAYRTAPAEAMRGTGPVSAGGKSFVERILPFMSKLPVRNRMTLRGIGRSKRRSASTVIAVVLSLVLILASGGMIDTMVNLVNKQFNEIALQDASVIAAESVTDDLVASIQAVPGVSDTEKVVSFNASVTASNETIATTLQGFDTDTVMHGWTNPSGGLPDNGVLAGTGLRDRLGLDIGDDVAVDLPAFDLTINLRLVEFVDEPLGTPLYASTETIEGAIAAAGADAAAIFAQPTVTTAMTLFDPTISRSTTLSAVEGLPGVLAVQDARTLYELVDGYLGLAYAFTGMMLLFGGLMALALMFNTISVNTAERSTEFATLKANGMADRTIAWMIAGENMLLTAIGVVPGLLLGYWAADLFMGLFNNDSFTMTLDMSPFTLVIAALAMFVVAALSMIPGVRSVRRLDIGAVVRERAV